MGTLNPNAAPFIPDDINIVKERVLDRSVYIPQDLISCHGHEYPNLPLNEIKSDESSNTAIEDYSEISILNPSASIFKPKVYGNINTINVGNNDESVESSSYAILKDLRLKNNNRIIFAHLNINSIRNKFHMVTDLIKGRIDILLISETKIDNTFPTSQFKIPGFSSPYRLDRSEHGGGILLYVREDIPSKQLPSQSFGEIECIIVEMNISKKKWLIYGTYNPNKSLISNHLSILSKTLDQYVPSYDNFILMGDFNSEVSEEVMSDFCELFNLKNLVKDPTCYKNPENPSCIDLILTNRLNSFQDTRVFETGLSDFHKLTATVLKTCFKKKPPKIISYRNYKNLSQLDFRNEADQFLSGGNIVNISNDEFVSIFMDILNKYAPLKFKYIRANDCPFMTKDLRKAIMLRTKLRNKFNKDRTTLANLAYKRQRNLCTSLVKKAKREYYGNLNPAVISDNKKFWRTVKPFFSDKVTTSENITLFENGNILEDDKKVSQIFSNFFSNAVKNLNIEGSKDLLMETVSEHDPINRAIQKYEEHPSILKIKEKIDGSDVFSFHPTDLESVIREILLLNTSKATPKDSIPPNIIKEYYDIFAYKILIDFNFSVNCGTFPCNQKLADISPVFKKGDNLMKSNYRPVSILPALSKIFERLLFSQINAYMDPKLSMHQCGFRKNMSAQNCLLVMLEKWKNCLDHKGNTGVLLTDLSKAFDCLNHDLLIAKLHAYGCDFNSLKLIYSYLTNRFQRVRVNSSYSLWSEIIYGVPQGSILGPLLFNIYLSDLLMFCENSNIANYADDNSPFSCNTNIESVISQLESDSNILLEWVKNNGLKANPDKFHLLLNDADEKYFIEIDNFKIPNSTCEKLLGINIDNKLSFDDHVVGLCSKASQKLHALSRISHFMKTKQRQIIMKSFIHSQFGYCPLVWMFHSRKLNNRINKIHERSLRIVYDDSKSTFRELLNKDNSFTIHERNIQTLAIELYKVVNELSPQLMSQVFPLKKYVKYFSKNPFMTRNVRTVRYGTETLAHLGPKIWAIIPNVIKDTNSVKLFKSKIKLWKPEKCPCKLCKTYIFGVGYVD